MGIFNCSETIEKIYQTFYDKLPNSLEDIMPIYDGCKIETV